MLSCIFLRKGVILYSGTVDGMSANEGFFELQADDTKDDRGFKNTCS
jgi:ABC-2 type transport system ATP-binding protein